MSTTVKPSTGGGKINRIGLPISDYKGGNSTLCAGCGHDAITSQIIRAFWEYGVEPHRLAKLSGIGCASKTPAYFLKQSHGLNAVHGRMPSISTGAVLGNRELRAIGVSGDGDSASIGLGQLCHLLRRNVPMIYVVENNGVYGLTKGQFSATADYGSTSKAGNLNDLPAMDICSLAIQLGCNYVARSFAGDPKQLVALIKGAIAHSGTALLDIVSPCVTFNNHEGSTKSYQFAKSNDELLHELSFVPFFEQINVDYDEGESIDVELHDGSHLNMRKLHKGYRPTDKIEALKTLAESADKQELLTGLVYVKNGGDDFLTQLDIVDRPLATLTQDETQPGPDALQEIMKSLM